MTTSPGGKGGNQAVAAARAGADVQLVAALGDDPAAWRWGDLHAVLKGVRDDVARVARGVPWGNDFMIHAAAASQNPSAVAQLLTSARRAGVAPSSSRSIRRSAPSTRTQPELNTLGSLSNRYWLGVSCR